MSTLAVMGVVAVLFVAFGLLRRRREDDCVGGSCASCGGPCLRSGPGAGQPPPATF